MAKFGEGDPRWLVEKREDGTNVNQWHWKEKDCIAWTRTRLEELFANLTVVSGSSKVHTTGVKSVEGDAILNVRKAKLIASYELAIKIKWEGTTTDGQQGSGLIELPYVADENDDEDPELKVVLATDSKPSQALKEAILASGKQPIYKAIQTLVSELKAGVPTKAASSSSSDQPVADTSQQGADAGNGTAPSTSGSQAAAGAAANGSSKPAAAAKDSYSSRKHSVKLTDRFYARAEDIYECFVVQGRVQAFTRSPAVVEAQPGGKFSWFSGHVQGTFEELVPGKRLVMSWRFNNWEDGCYSKVVISLTEPEPGNTVLELTHTGLPEADKFGNSDVEQQVEEGWQRQIFSQIKAIFGYGV